MKELTIGEIAQRAQIQTSAIRYYERVGLLPIPKRINGRRYYDPSILQRLELIQIARQAGFRISELQLLFTESEDGPVSTRWHILVTTKLAEMETLIQQAETIKKWLTEAPVCQCVQVDDCSKIMLEHATDKMHLPLLKDA